MSCSSVMPMPPCICTPSFATSRNVSDARALAMLAARLTADYPWVLTVEDHAAMGGFGGATLEALSLRDANASKVKIHAIPDRFLQHADRSELLKFLHLDAEGIADVCSMLAAGQPAPGLDPSQRGKFLYEE